jgi:glycosyltransferase Alg8
MKQVDVHRRFHLSLADLGRFLLLVGALVVLLLSLPNNLYCPANRRIILTLGVLGLWRYTWWLVHFVRSQIYARYVFPPLRQKAEALWESGWRPKRVLYMITTFKEVRSTTEKLVASLVDEVRTTGIPARVFFGTYDDLDEQIIATYLRRHARGIDLELVFVRQNLPGKRIAIGLVLRAMSRYGVRDDDLVVFMDGDTYVEPGMLRKCLPLFAVCSELDALTTDERSVIVGPKWMQWWIDMRMAQRQLAMQSIALAGKLLTLTGRCSFFRARHVVEERFIRLVEADYLDSWLWGRFRFLSGDDKSTAYALLSQPGGAVLRYVPDAVATTIEYVEGGGFTRVRQNLLRWSGNLLRNGRRCIALGPEQLGWFAWWCFLDQRIAMWTTLIGVVMAMMLTALQGPQMLVAVVVIILLTRFVLSLFLWYYAGRVYTSFVWLLYFNQITNAAVKAYLLFRLAKQRWRNRGDQRVAENTGWLPAYQNFMGSYLTYLYLVAFVFTLFAVFLLDGLPPLPVVRHVLGWR